MNLPTFETQPNERNELQPRLIEALAANGLNIYEVDGLFDLLVSNPEGVDSYLELKVRLASQNHSIPLSRLQWQCLNEHQTESKFENSYRILIYDYREGGKYALANASTLQAGISQTAPASTSYVSAQTLNELQWLNSAEQGEVLLRWLKR